jgi:hypothetical protein
MFYSTFKLRIFYLFSIFIEQIKPVAFYITLKTEL